MWSELQILASIPWNSLVLSLDSKEQHKQPLQTFFHLASISSSRTSRF
jgi:hypothetical protein